MIGVADQDKSDIILIITYCTENCKKNYSLGAHNSTSNSMHINAAHMPRFL